MLKKISLSLFGLIAVVIVSFFIQPALAVTAPIVSLSGDDVLANGGNDDPYDSLVVLDITSDYAVTTAWEIEYSFDSGRNWELVTAPYDNLSNVKRRYYWSTSGLNSSFIMLRARVRSNSEVSSYTTKTFNLKHRFSNVTNKFLAENFITKDFSGSSVDSFWNISQGDVSLQPTVASISSYDSSLSGSWPLTQANSRTEELIVNEIANVGDARIDNGSGATYHFNSFVSTASSFTGDISAVGIGMAFLETNKFLADSGDTIKVTGNLAVSNGVLQNFKLAIADCATCALLSDEYQSGLTGNFQANLLIGNSQAVSLARLTADASAGATVAVANLIVKNITPKVLDETVYRDNLTIIGPTFTVNHLGSVNSALSFDGQNDYLDVSDTPNWSLGNNFSFSAWIYLTNNVSFPIFQRDSAELGAPYFSIENGRLAFGKTSYSVLAGEILYPQIIGSAVLGVGSWHNVAVTVNGVGDSPTVKFYIDGVFDAAVGIPGTENYTHRGELMFGRFTQPAVKYANGKMSDLKFFNHTLTDVEVAALAANGTLQPLTVAWWKLNEDPATWLGAGQLLADSSFNNLSAAAVGQAKGTFFGKYGNAGDFDGNGDYLDAGEHNPSKFSAGDSFTLSAWFKGRDLLDSGLLDRGRYGLIVGDLCPAARLGFYIDTSETEVFNPLTVCSVTTLQPDIWYQATAVYQDDDNGAGSLYLYLNGKLEATVSGNDLSSQDVLGNLLIGRSLRVGDFNGLIDEVKIFSGAKTAVDIAHDYSADVNTTFSASGQITSANLLANYSSGVLRMTLQPAQSLNGGAIEYQVSNDGVNWYGDNSGLPTSNVWYNFSSDFTPNPATFTFASLGEKIYWRARLTSSADGKSPVIYQLRINWEDNHPPQACFTVNPVRSDSTSTVFSFYGDCSSDPDPGIINPDNSLYDLSFRWDWNNDGNFDTDWVSGIGDGFLAIHAFDSTSTTAIKLEVKDPFNATDQFVNSINEVSTESNLSGWLWSSNYGWTSLNCDNIYYGESSRLCDLDYGWKMTADHKITGWAWNDNIGWLCAGESCGEQAPDGADSFITYSTADGTVIGWAKYVLFGAGGWMQLRGNWCGEDPANDQCVHFDKVRGALYGWGWAGGQDGTILTGPGWSQFSGTMNIPWFETRYGTVYSRSNVGSAQTTMAPSNRFNASYCVFAAGSIINLTSEQNCAAVGYADLGFPTATNQYKTSLGTIDFKRLLNGQEIVNNSETVDLPATLDGKVYHFSNPNGVSIDNAITFNNAFDLASSGAGTVVIDGDLRINKNLYYEDAPVTGKIENLASVVWIVKGDIIIDPSVSNLVGLFIALGKDGVNCPDNHCGQFKTGDDTQSPRQLIIKGAIMARKLVFQRTYKVSSEPAEQIIYDGRTAVNTPFGLEDLGKGLPLFRETPSASQ